MAAPTLTRVSPPRRPPIDPPPAGARPRLRAILCGLLVAGSLACRPSLLPPKVSPQGATLGRIEVRLARLESQLADLGMQAQMAEAARARRAQQAARPAAPSDDGAPLASGGRALAQGDLALAQGYFAQALSRATARSPAAAQALLGLVDTAIAQGAHGVAMHHLERFMTEHPGHPCAEEAALKLGLALEALEAYGAAQRIFVGIVTDHPHSTSAQVARVHLEARPPPLP